MSIALRTFAKKTRRTPQTEKADATQVQNNAGGFVYALDVFKALERFLILGTEGGTYYVKEQAHTQQAAQNVIKAIETDGKRAVDLVVAISDSGRAPKNDPALFALALAAASVNPSTRAYALANLSRVARIPTHLFHFVDYVTGMRGWGRGLRSAIGTWYTSQSPEKLAYQLVKYQARDGWSNKDIAILSHPEAKSAQHSALWDWVLRGQDAISEETPDIILAFYEAQHVTPKKVAELIRDYGLTREMVPTVMLNETVVWEALLEKMPMTALIRNLGTLSKLKMLEPFSDHTTAIVKQLSSQAALKKARVHPLTLLNAMKTYATGHGFRGSASWPVNEKIVDALNDSFYLAFGNVTPTGKRVMLALDVSGSMGGGVIANSQLNPREASAALALITANVEPNYVICGFTAGEGKRGRYGYAEDGFSLLKISPKQRLDDVIDEISDLDFGQTDCALPMITAEAYKWKVDAFAIYTDNETYAGTPHPMQALRSYRNASGIGDAKLIVCGMTATNFTIADPRDPLTLDVVGFDVNAPQVLSEFIRG